MEVAVAICCIPHDPLGSFVLRARRILLGACAVAFVSCGGGQGGGDVPGDSVGAAGAQGTEGPGISLNQPSTVGESNRIGLIWQASSNLTSFTVLVKRAAELDFEPVDATVGSNSAQFARGASWRLDFPTASVRVRGCDASNQCVDSNEQPLLDALVTGLARFASPTQPFFTGPLRLSADGNTLAVWDLSAFGPEIAGPCEGISSKGAVLVFHRDADGRWTQEANLTRHSVLGLFGPGVALSGDGNTLIAPAYQDSGTVGGINAPEVGAIFALDKPHDDRGAIHVYTRDAQHQWSHQAFIKPAVTVANEGFGVRVEVTHDGNRVLVGARDHVYLFEREAGQWRQAKILEGTPGSLIDMQLSPFLEQGLTSQGAAGVMAISANGSTIALRTAASKDVNGMRLPPFGVRVYAQCNCADNWQQVADLSSAKADTLRDEFGKSLSFSGDGTTLAVGAPGDPGSDTDDPSTSNVSSLGAGAVYIFATDGGAWQRRAFLKGRGALPCDRVGEEVVLSGDGKVLAARTVGMAADLIGVDPRADGLRRNQRADAVTSLLQESCGNNRFAGGVFEANAYVFEADPSGVWSHTAVALAATRVDLTISHLLTGPSIALSADAQTMGILFGRFNNPLEADSTRLTTITVY
jgi:hypothetical protein